MLASSTLQSILDSIADFHTACGYRAVDDGTLGGQDVRGLWRRLIAEEAQELIAGIDNDDLVSVADGIGDMLYVLLAAANVWRLPLSQILEEIHRSNMTKVLNSNEIVRREDGKVLKGAQYEAPNIKSILISAGFHV